MYRVGENRYRCRRKGITVKTTVFPIHCCDVSDRGMLSEADQEARRAICRQCPIEMFHKGYCHDFRASQCKDKMRAHWRERIARGKCECWQKLSVASSQ